jgi:hypothetical protein
MSTAAIDELPPDLAQLEALAAGADAQISDAIELVPSEPQPEVDQAAELAAMLQFGVMVLTPLLPFLPKHYTPDACKRIGGAFYALAMAKGWSLDAISNPWLALAIVSAPPTIGAVMEGREYFAKLREDEAKAKPEPVTTV